MVRSVPFEAVVSPGLHGNFRFKVSELSLCGKETFKTRMHSNRMRTGRSLTVCRGCFLPGGVCLPPGGASFLGGVLSPRGVPPSCGGVLPSQGVVSQHALRQTPPVKRITHTSKNISLATTSLRPVMIVDYNKKALQSEVQQTVSQVNNFEHVSGRHVGRVGVVK